VIIRVAYDVHPDGYAPYGTFPYILETGAGWWEAIGQGSITYRLPYDVNATNTVLNPNAYDGQQPPSVQPNPANLEVTGPEVVWRFSELEPTPQDNVQLTVLVPAVWDEIVAARGASSANPDDLEIQLRLARALDGALSFKYGLDPIGDSPRVAEEAEAAYLRALELAPDDVDIYVEYLDWLGLFTPPLGPLPDNFKPALERALVVAPDDARLIELSDWLAQVEPSFITPTASAPATGTATAIPSATSEPTATATAAPAATATPTDRPTTPATVVIERAPTETPAPRSPQAPSPAPESGSGGICPSALLALGGPVLLVAVGRRRRTHKTT
jgi:hypothetical protein